MVYSASQLLWNWGCVKFLVYAYIRKTLDQIFLYDFYSSSFLVASKLHTRVYLLSNPCRLVSLGSSSTLMPKNQLHLPARKQELPNEFQAGIWQTQEFLNAGGSCTINKYHTQTFMLASCVLTGIKHQSGNTVNNTAGSSLKEKTTILADHVSPGKPRRCHHGGPLEIKCER